MSTSSKGINTAGLLVAVFVIGLVGAFIWTTTYERTDSSPDVAETNTEQGNESELSSETANWRTVVAEKHGISYKYPEGDEWSSALSVVESSLSGHEATLSVNYTKCGPNCGYALSINILDKESEAGSRESFGEEQMQGNDYYTLASTKTVTVDGVSGTRWEYAPSDDNAATVVYYYFSSSNFSYTFTVNNNGAKTDEVDLTATGEKIVETVQFIR